MNTFSHPIPARTFLKNGGNILKSEITFSGRETEDVYNVLNRENNILNVESKTTGNKTKIHLDMCWVNAKILVD